MIALAEPRGLATDGPGLARAFDGAPVAVALFDRELRLVRANGRFRSLTGCPGGMPSLLALHEIFPTSLVAVGPALTAARRGAPYPPIPVRFPRAGGHGVTAEVSIAWLPEALQRGDQGEDGLLFVAAELDRADAIREPLPEALPEPLPGATFGPADRPPFDAEVPRRHPTLADAPAPRRGLWTAQALVPSSREAAGAAPALPRALAHDLANVLNLIGSAAHMLLLRSDDPELVRTYAARIAGAVERGASLIAGERAAGAGGADAARAADAGAASSAPVAPPVAPAAPGEPAATSAPAVADARTGGRHVLVVEDDDSSRDILTTVLERAGHRVCAVGGVAEALAALEAAMAADGGARAIEVVVTDIGLGDGNGWELAAEVRTRWPGLRVGVVTGWDAEADPGVRTDFVLRKPIRLPELVACVAGGR